MLISQSPQMPASCISTAARVNPSSSVRNVAFDAT
jgi:hypothetical protein